MWKMILMAIIAFAIYTSGAISFDGLSLPKPGYSRQAVTYEQQALDQSELSKLEAQIERRIYWTKLIQWFVNILLVGSVISVMVIAWIFVDRRDEQRRRIKDGSFPIHTYVEGNDVIVIDPNKIPTGVLRHNKKTGLTDFGLPAMSSRLAALISSSVQATRTVNALGAAEGGFKYAATGKFLAGAYNRSESSLPSLEDENPVIAALPEPIVDIGIETAIAESKPNAWLIGRNKELGTRYYLNIDEVVHFGIPGSTGKGKTTYLAFLIAGLALRDNCMVQVFNGKISENWAPLYPYISYEAITYEMMPVIVRNLTVFYEDRANRYKSAGYRTFSDAYRAGEKPVIIFFEEFGAIMDSLRLVMASEYKEVVVTLSNLVRLSRDAGLHFVFMDQDPSRWPGQIRANCPVNLVMGLGGSKGNSLSEYNVHKLGVGQFQVSGTVYDTWPTWQYLDLLTSGLKINRRELDELENFLLSRTIRSKESQAVDHQSMDGSMDGGIASTIPPSSMDHRPSIDGHVRSQILDDDLYEAWLANDKSIRATCLQVWGKVTNSKRRRLLNLIAERSTG